MAWGPESALCLELGGRRYICSKAGRAIELEGPHEECATLVTAMLDYAVSLSWVLLIQRGKPVSVSFLAVVRRAARVVGVSCLTR